MRAIEPWVERPLSAFLDDSAARVAAVITHSGQVVAQHGFARATDLMAVASLASGIMAAASELSRVIGAPLRPELAYEGRDLGIYLAAIELPGRRWFGLVGFDRDSSLGLVQVFFEEMVGQLLRAARALYVAPPLYVCLGESSARTARRFRPRPVSRRAASAGPRARSPIGLADGLAILDVNLVGAPTNSRPERRRRRAQRRRRRRRQRRFGRRGSDTARGIRCD